VDDGGGLDARRGAGSVSGHAVCDEVGLQGMRQTEKDRRGSSAVKKRRFREHARALS